MPGDEAGLTGTVSLVRHSPVPAPRISSRKRLGPPAHRATPAATHQVPFDPDAGYDETSHSGSSYNETGYDNTLPAPDYIPTPAVRTMPSAAAKPLLLQREPRAHEQEPLLGTGPMLITAPSRGRRASSAGAHRQHDQMWDRITQLLGDGAPEQSSLISDLIASFHGRSALLLAQLAQALTDQDLDAIRVHAQTITESGRMLSACDIVIIGEQIDADAGTEDLEACLMNLPHLMLAVMDAREQLELLTQRLLTEQ